MKFSVARISSLVGVLAILLLAVTMVGAQQHDEGLTLDTAVLTGTDLSDAQVAKSSDLTSYIIVLTEDAAATYSGGVRGYEAASAGPDAIQAYANYLIDQQANFLASIGQSLNRTVSNNLAYQYAVNAVVVDITAEEATSIAARSDVRFVEEVQKVEVDTDVGPAWIGAPSIWDGSANAGVAAQGEGVVVAILDSGVNADHPSFAAMDKNAYTAVNPLGASNYLGACDSANAQFDAGAVCNSKLIGAYDAYFMAGLTPDDPTPVRGEDENGHGSHTASTVAGNYIDAAFAAPAVSGGVAFAISGVAPHANIVTFDVCSSRGSSGEPGRSCITTASVAAIEEVARLISVDSVNIRALNYSIGGGADAYNSSVELGFLELTKLGVFVAASAGNSGPGASTLGHQGSWVHTSGASTHNRGIDNGLTTLTGGTPPADLAGTGLTDGFGPASIVYAGDFTNSNDAAGDDPAQCLTPFPAGTFNGQIVVCDRGAIARTAKGQHVLAGGAGGFVLANLDAQGESISGDAHFLPGIHIGATAGNILRDWLATASATDNYTAVITGYSFDTSGTGADVMAGFSSRGPNSRFDVIKPDITAPGVSIFAAVADAGVNVTGEHEFDFYSGTSMSSPHTAGAGALMAQIHPDWTPQEIKSALMMTAVTDGVLKEDGATPANPFDRGSGRVALEAAAQAGLILDETHANFVAANPATGGDSRTLNLASMMDSECYINCSFTRTVTNPTDQTIEWTGSFDLPAGVYAAVTPETFTIAPDGSQELTIDILVSAAPTGDFLFAQLNLMPGTGSRAVGAVHMPIAVYPAKSQDDTTITKVADVTSAAINDTVNFTVTVENNALVSRTFTIMDALPTELTYVDGSVTGATYDPATTTLSQVIELGPSGEIIDAVTTTAAGGYDSLAGYGVTPATLPSEPDDGCLLFNLNSGLGTFEYLGTEFNQIIVNMNGTISLGLGEGACTTAGNSAFPTTDEPGNLLAPWWTDLSAANSGNLYVAGFNSAVGPILAIEWEDFGYYGDTTSRATFQVWLYMDLERVFFTYPASFSNNTATATIGAQNASGTLGDTFYFNGAGALPDGSYDIEIENTLFSSPPAVITFATTVNDAGDGIIVNEASATVPDTDDAERASTEKAYAAVTIGEFTSVSVQQADSSNSNQYVMLAIVVGMMVALTGIQLARRKH